MIDHNTPVRELEWRETGPDDPYLLAASSPFGTYNIGWEGGALFADLDGLHAFEWEWEPDQDARSYSDETAAQDACQSDFQKRVNECLAHTNCDAKATGWRDIESAPKDWSNILLYPAPKNHNDSVVAGYAVGDHGLWQTTQDYPEPRHVNPTHWRPLPPPPGQEDGEPELVTRLRMEAERWAQEARTHKASLHECYQAVTGATGEPGNWHGANPIREYVAAHEALRAEKAELKEGSRRIDRLVKKIDVILHGEDGAAPQALLCDMVGPIAELKARYDKLEAAAARAKTVLDAYIQDFGEIRTHTDLDAATVWHSLDCAPSQPKGSGNE